MAENVYLTPEERLSEFSDLLLQSIIRDDELSLQNRKYLLSQVPIHIFKNENYIILYVYIQVILEKL